MEKFGFIVGYAVHLGKECWFVNDVLHIRIRKKNLFG